MEITNGTRMIAGWTMGTDKSAREHIVLVVKGTFAIPHITGPVELLPQDQQMPLVMADTFEGEPGFSAPAREVDFALRKLRCDVLLDAAAYAPEGRPAERVRVGVKLGRWSKVFDCVGNRVWTRRGAVIGPSAPQPFQRLPISYGCAFGGVDALDPDEPQPEVYRPNPAGRGWHRVKNQERVIGAPLPNTEASNDGIASPWGNYRSMAFGPIGRHWTARIRWAGTYDQDWIDNVFPFLPADFDDRYYQAAPDDQQTDYLRGGEDVVLVNLTPEGRTTFRLPDAAMPVVFLRRDGSRDEQTAVLDTVLIEPDQRRLQLTWRATLPLRRNVFEVSEAIVGRMSRGWWRAREGRKIWHPSLGALVRAKRDEVP